MSKQIKEDLAEWKVLSKKLLWHFKAIDLFNALNKAIEAACDEQYRANKILHHNKNKVIGTYFKDSQDYGTEYIKKEQKKQETAYIGNLSKEINAKLKITEVASSYGLNLKGTMCRCPFHNDKTPSLSFTDSLNLFNCFGCGKKGNLIKFIQLMEVLNDK